MTEYRVLIRMRLRFSSFFCSPSGSSFPAGSSAAMSMTHDGISLLLFLIITGLSAQRSTASLYDHRYNLGEEVPFFVNKVGPLSAPSETYPFYDFPFCCPDIINQKRGTLGEVLNGDRMASALYDLKFREDNYFKTLCDKKLNPTEVAKLRNAVREDYYFQMYYDHLPLWAFFGKIDDQNWTSVDEGPKYYLFTHVRFDVLYNGNQIVEINALSDPAYVVDITKDGEINAKFTYSVSWNVTSDRFVNRMDKYFGASSIPIIHSIHWFSFFNSIAILVLLTGLFMLLYIRHLKNDVRKCSADDEEVGWKLVQGDVFRCPPNMSLFCAVLGTGTQLLTLICILFLLAVLGFIYPYSRGTLLSSIVLIYAVTSVVAGYSAASFHCKFAETGWEKTVFITGILYLGPSLLVIFFLNFVAISYKTTSALPIGTIFVLFLVYVFISVPLLALGGMIAHYFKSNFQSPCVTKRYPRGIPPLSWYQKQPCQMLIAGFLSFCAIILELRHFYASVWGHKIYTLPSILLFTFLILIAVIVIISICLTYIQLSIEDHQWWWRSVCNGGSTAIFMFGYCIVFYAQSNMNGFLQMCFFIGYNACICYAFFLMLGSISFYASLMFVRHMFRAVKSE